jgi:hypothetical protein
MQIIHVYVRPLVVLIFKFICLFICFHAVHAHASTANQSTLLTAEQTKTPTHLQIARDLLANTPRENTNYQHKSDIRTTGLFNSKPIIRTDCSGLISHLLREVDYKPLNDVAKKTPQSRHPLAEHFYDAIIKGESFIRVQHARDVQEGDIIAWKYADRTGKEDTGHVLLVNRHSKRSKAAPKNVPQSLIQDTTQHEIEVIDSSRSPHSPDDTRFVNGEKKDGLGRGKLLLYENRSGDIVGYSYLNKGSKFRGQDEVVIAVGRLR